MDETVKEESDGAHFRLFGLSDEQLKPSRSKL